MPVDKEKAFPWAAVLLNLIVSGVASMKELPVPPIGSLEQEFLGIALLGALVGTVFGLKIRWWWSMGFAILAVATRAEYSTLWRLGGLTHGELLEARFCYFAVFLGGAEVLATFEKLLFDLAGGNNEPGGPTTPSGQASQTNQPGQTNGKD
jgi:hypothetical protein